MLGISVFWYSKMEIERIVAFGMVFIMLILSVVGQPLLTVASGFAIQSKVCGGDRISYSVANGHEVFYINGNIIDRVLFCKALQFYQANDCIFETLIRSGLCGLDYSSVDLSFKKARELLQKEEREESSMPEDDHSVPPREEKNEGESLATPRNIGVGATGAFVLCCVFLCPCFYKKSRASTHTMLAKDPNSNSTSSYEANSTSDKIRASPLRVPPSPSRFSMSPKLSRLGSLHLNPSQVVRATHNFSKSLIIGEGGFGTVYKGQLEDGHVVAIKRAKKEHFENLRTEFSSEVELLSKIDHQNLVKLLGYVDRGHERLIITEYVSNGTLREHLDVQHGKILDFHQRLGIAIDIAHGLTYLHLYAEKQIIHRDVKSSNILLTESMRAKVADFGFARLGPMEADVTHISTQVKGTVGYLDPDYMKTYQLTTKSDVYSFGILLVEILTGRRPLEIKKPLQERVTVRWAFNKYNDGNVVALLDPLMKEAVNTRVLMKMFDLAFRCASPVRSDRPEMKIAGEELWAIRADYLNKTARKA